MAHCDKSNSIHLEQKPASLKSYTAVQKFEISKIYFKEITFIQQECIKLIKSDSKYTYNVTNDIK